MRFPDKLSVHKRLYSRNKEQITATIRGIIQLANYSFIYHTFILVYSSLCGGWININQVINHKHPLKHLTKPSQTPQYSLSNVHSLVKCVEGVYGYSRLGRGLSRGNFQTLILRHSDKIQYLGICYTSAFKNK